MGTLAGTTVAPALLTEIEKPETPGEDDPRLAAYEKQMQVEREKIVQAITHIRELEVPTFIQTTI